MTWGNSLLFPTTTKQQQQQQRINSQFLFSALIGFVRLKKLK